MKLFVCGAKGHGKDFLCEYLQFALGVSFVSSSEAAMDEVYRNSLYLQSKYSTAREAHDNRDEDRPVWFDKIVEINTPDITTLSTRIFNVCEIYCGMRNIDELNGAKSKWGSEVITVYVDASKRLESEPMRSNTILKDDCTLSISNNRSKEEFLINSHLLFAKLFKRDSPMEAIRNLVNIHLSRIEL